MLITFEWFLGFLQPDSFTAEGVNVESTFFKDVCIKNTYARDVTTVKYLGIYSQFFSISELRLINTRLEIEIAAG